MNSWISVEDRLPELGDYSVAVHYENDSVEMAHVEDWVRDKRCEGLYKILHWMTLPQPPKD